MTAIYSLAPNIEASATLTTINSNIDGLEAAVGTPADVASATGSLLARLGAIVSFVDGLEAAMGTTGDAASINGSLLARLGAIASFVDALEGFTDGVESALGTAVAVPATNTINANINRNIKASAQCSSSVDTQGSKAVTANASVLVAAAGVGIDWRRILIHNNGSLTILIALGVVATPTLYSVPLPAGAFMIAETLASITALSTGGATTCLVTVEN